MTTITAPLVGMRHHPGASEKLETLGFGDGLVLEREPENPYDTNAIKVFTLDNIFLGYIAREYAADWAQTFDGNDLPEAHLTFGSNGWPRVEIELGDEETTEENSDALPESERGEIQEP
jgi:hypothetical protein